MTAMQTPPQPPVGENSDGNKTAVQKEIARLKIELRDAMERANNSEIEASKAKGIELLFPFLRRG